MVTVTELNRAPNITVNAIDAASVSADDTTVGTLEAETIVDGADVSHTEELADLDDTLDTGDVTSSNWGDFEIQKDGTDGAGIINFKTN